MEYIYSVSAIEASVRDVLMTAVSNSILGRNTNLEMPSEMVISSFPLGWQQIKRGGGIFSLRVWGFPWKHIYVYM